MYTARQGIPPPDPPPLLGDIPHLNAHFPTSGAVGSDPDYVWTHNNQGALITDAASAALAQHQILQQAGSAMLAQGNQLPQQVLALLRG